MDTVIHQTEWFCSKRSAFDVCGETFQQCVTNMENKLSTKLAYWLMDKEIEKRARDIVQKQKIEAGQLEITSTLSSVAKGKIRYLAGACIQRVNKRIKASVLR